MHRGELHQRFVDRFTDRRSEAISGECLGNVEGALGFVFPTAYQYFVRQHGAVRVDGTLRSKVAHQIDLWDIRSFLTECELLEVSRLYANAGLSASFVPFASDSMGNLFCFMRGDPRDRDDAAVWFFDHEFAITSKLAESFDAWLARYVELPAELETE